MQHGLSARDDYVVIVWTLKREEDNRLIDIGSGAVGPVLLSVLSMLVLSTSVK